MAKKSEKQEQRIRITLRAYDNKIIDKCAHQIADTIERVGGTPVGPVPLPTEISKFTVNRSSFIDKAAREQFEMRIHKRLIELNSTTSKTVDELMKLDLPAGVDVEIKAFGKEHK
jgi:small subunit ribosomal protein S10